MCWCCGYTDVVKIATPTSTITSDALAIGETIFITFGFFLIPIGYKFGWGWIANTKLRIFHSGMMAFVTLETLLGITCPLTSIENSLRGIHQSKSFIGYWVKQIIYWDFQTQFFIILYCIYYGTFSTYGN